MNHIGILCAGDSELEPFLPHIRDCRVFKRAMLSFYQGAIHGVPVTALYSGVCRVNAAIASQLLIDCFHVDAIVNAGTAGGMAEEVQLFDTIIPPRSAYYDMDADILTDFHPWMETVWFHSDPRLLSIAQAYSPICPHPIRFGPIVTGERFVADSGRGPISRQFSPLAVDMETAGIAHVCYVNQLPFLAVRSITDTASHMGAETFEENCPAASSICAEIVMALLEDFGRADLSAPNRT